MNKNKIIFSILGLVILAGGVLIGTSLVQKNQEIRSKAAPATTLFISPATQTKSPGQEFVQSVVMNTGTNQIIGVQFDIRFNPQALEDVKVASASGIAALNQLIENSVDNAAGKISYAAFTLNQNGAVNGQNIPALTITGKIKPAAAVGSYQTSFGANTKMSARGEGQNVLANSTAGTVNVQKNGDVDGNGMVNIVDIGLIIDAYGTTPLSDTRCDLNSDGKADIIDIGIVIDNLQ